MSVVSIRFSDEPVHDRLREAARRQRVAVSTLAERLIDEGLRAETHPLVTFRPGAAGRRACLIGGPEVVDVVTALIGSDVAVQLRRTRAAELLDIPVTLVDAALAYYADFTEEVDEAIAERARLADEAEASWRRQQAILEQ
ncbi:MAG: CopG family transcriptional regulator [Actinomycetota bacterium]